MGVCVSVFVVVCMFCVCACVGVGVCDVCLCACNVHVCVYV